VSEADDIESRKRDAQSLVVLVLLSHE
jgi:hypothetical protein